MTDGRRGELIRVRSRNYGSVNYGNYGRNYGNENYKITGKFTGNFFSLKIIYFAVRILLKSQDYKL